VVNKLKEQGIEKSDITREEFLEHAWEWTHKHGGSFWNSSKNWEHPVIGTAPVHHG